MKTYFLINQKSKNFKLKINRICSFRPGLPSVASAKEGQIILIPLILIFVVLIFSASIFSRLGIFIKSGNQSVINDQAIVLADGGVDYAINKLNSTSGAYSGSPTLDIYDGPAIFGQIQTALTGSGGSPRTVTSTGCIPTCNNARAKRKVTVIVERPTMQVSFPYAAHGLRTIGTAVTVDSSIIDGNVYANGSIACTGSSPTINGAANYVLTPIPTCGSPKNPVSATFAPIINVGDGTTPGWKKTAQDGGPPMNCTAGCSLTNNDYYLGPIKINGSVTVGENARVHVTGPIWITQNLTVSSTGGPASVSLDNSLNTCGTVIAVDGTITLTGNSTIMASATSPKHYLILAQTTAVVDGDGISVNGSSSTTIHEAIFYSADSSGQALSNVSFSGANLSIFSGSAIGRRVSVTAGTRLSAGGLTNAKFCGLSNTFEVQRGSYKISK